MGKLGPAPNALYTLVYTDVCNSTAANEIAGDAAAHRALQAHDEIVRKALARHEGTELTHLGDGFKLALPDPARAVAFAVEVQRGLEALRQETGAIAVRIGVHAGEAILDGGDLHGRTVIVAQRVMARAQPAQILVSADAAARAGPDVALIDRGRFLLKGIREALQLFEVPWRSEGALPASVPLPLARDVEPPPPLVGREGEFAALETWLEGAEKGASRFALVTGEAGIGKTRLCTDFLEHVAKRPLDRAVARARADGEEPYGPLFDAIGQLAGGRRPPRALAPALAAIGRTAPLLAGTLGLPRWSARRSAHDDDPVRFRGALASLLVAWSRERPLVLLLDDVQWLDSASLELVRAIGRRMAPRTVGENARLLVLATLREDDAGARPLAGLLRELGRDRVLERIALGGLPGAGVQSLVRTLLPDRATDEVSRRILQRSQGNPFFVEELCRDLAERAREPGAGGAQLLAGEPASVPEQIKAVLEERFARLSPACVEALRVAALLGPSFRLDVWRESLGASPELLEGCVEEAITARLLLPARDQRPLRYGFAHVLVAEALRDAPRTPRQQRRHLAIADALERLAPEAPAELARHLIAAGEAAPDDRVARWCRTAGTAAELHAPREAERMLAEALAARVRLGAGGDAESDAIRLLLFEALGQLGEVTRAAEIAQEAIAGLDARGDQAAADRARARLARIFTQHALPSEALRTLAPAIEPRDGAAPSAAALAEYAVALDLAGDARRMKDTARALLRIARRERNAELHERGLSVLRNWWANHSFELRRALALSRRLLASAEARRDPSSIATAGCDVALFELVLGQVRRALATLEPALREAERADAIASLLNIRAIRALAFCFRGEWDRCAEEWSQAEPLLGRVPGALRVGLLLWARVRRDLWLGRSPEPAPPTGGLYGGIAQFQSDVLAGTGLLAAESGNAAAATILERASERQARPGVGVNWLTAAQSIAAGWVALGDAERAEPWSAALAPYQGTLLVGCTDLTLGQIARLAGRFEEAEAHLARAARLARRESLRPWLALVRAEQARLWALSPAASSKRIHAAVAESRSLAESLGMREVADVTSAGGSP